MEKLASHGYYEVPHTHGIWKHISRPIQFSIIVNNFGVKYSRKEHIDHLIRTLKSEFTIIEDFEGSLYCGISIKWNYKEG